MVGGAGGEASGSAGSERVVRWCWRCRRGGVGSSTSMSRASVELASSRSVSAIRDASDTLPTHTDASQSRRTRQCSEHNSVPRVSRMQRAWLVLPVTDLCRSVMLASVNEVACNAAACASLQSAHGGTAEGAWSSADSRALEDPAADCQQEPAMGSCRAGCARAPCGWLDKGCRTEQRLLDLVSSVSVSHLRKQWTWPARQQARRPAAGVGYKYLNVTTETARYLFLPAMP